VIVALRLDYTSRRVRSRPPSDQDRPVAPSPRPTDFFQLARPPARPPARHSVHTRSPRHVCRHCLVVCQGSQLWPRAFGSSRRVARAGWLTLISSCSSRRRSRSSFLVRAERASQRSSRNSLTSSLASLASQSRVSALLPLSPRRDASCLPVNPPTRRLTPFLQIYCNPSVGKTRHVRPEQARRMASPTISPTGQVSRRSLARGPSSSTQSSRATATGRARRPSPTLREAASAACSTSTRRSVSLWLLGSRHADTCNADD